MDDKSVTYKVEDTSLASKRFPSPLQLFESTAVEFKIKTEPFSEETKSEVTYQLVPQFNITENGEREIKHESVDASSSDIISPAGIMSLSTDSRFTGTEVIIKEEDLGIWFEESEESVPLDGNSWAPFDNEGESQSQNKKCATLELNQETDECNRSGVSSQAPAVFSVETGAATESQERGSLLCVTSVPKYKVNHCKCMVCELPFQTRQLLRTHLRTCHGKPFSCNHCSAAFGEIEQLKCHSTFHFNEALLSLGNKKPETQSGSTDEPFAGAKCLTTVARTVRVPDRSKRRQEVVASKITKCAECPATFRDVRLFLLHCLVHVRAGPLSCPHCTATYTCTKSYQKHVKLHTNLSEEKRSATQCATFQNETRVAQHIIAPLNDNPSFLCEQNLKTYTKKEPEKKLQESSPVDCNTSVVFETTEKAVHPAEEPSQKTDEISSNEASLAYANKERQKESQAFTPLDCNTSILFDTAEKEAHPAEEPSQKTDEISANEASLAYANKKTQKESEDFISLDCNASVPFDAEENSSTREEASPVEELSQETEKSFNCSKCPATFERKEIFQPHLTGHSKMRRLSCPHCAATFERNDDLQNHLTTHVNQSEDKLFSCPHCPLTFSSQVHLDRHSVVHSNERHHSCAHCADTFKNKSSLHKLMNTHVSQCEAKRFSCPRCSATFLSEGCLKQHSNVHSNDRPYSCTLCAAKFKSKSGLHRHLNIHRDPSGRKRFACTQCNAAFDFGFLLKQHLITHPDIRPQ